MPERRMMPCFAPAITGSFLRLRLVLGKFQTLSTGYELGRDLWTYARWAVLKGVATLVYVVLGRTPQAERRVIIIGNCLFKRTYPNAVHQSYESYVRNYPPNLSLYFKLLSPEQWLLGRRILDVGSGLGQYSALLARSGAALVVSLEYQYPKALFGKNRFKEVESVVNASATALPFLPGVFDTVFSHTVFEHIPDVEAALRELAATLEDQGIVLLSYNYIHHRGGHHLFPYIHFPWPTWVVSERSLCEYWSKKLARDQQRGLMLFYPRGCQIESLSTGSEIGLNKLNYEQFEALVSCVGLYIDKRLGTERIGQLLPALQRVPGLKYFMSGTVYYALRKRGDKAEQAT